MSNEILIVDISELKDVSSLCRVCLTESSEMASLHSPLHVIYEDDVKLVIDVLQKFTNEPLAPDSKYPSYVCPICLDLLNVAYKLHVQLEVSRQQLCSYFECDIVSDADAKLAPVEVISSHGKYNLRDLIIIEDHKPDATTYEGFLKNLGSEISADFANEKVNTSKPVMPEVFSVNVIPINNNVCEDVVVDDSCKEIAKTSVTEEDKNVVKVKSKPKRAKPRKNEQIKCNLCDKTFSLKRNLNRHKSEMHCEKNYLCQVCGHVAKAKSSLYNHFMLKHLEKRFECDICGKKYITKSHLRCHKLVHKNERVHLCTVCGKGFNYANALEYHMRTHTGEKKYKCTYCERAFSMRCGLNRHLRTHTGLRPYKCKHCDKAFRSKGEVDCHEMSHTGYRPYWCMYCKKGFTKMYNLKMHMMGHTGPHTCDFCKRGFLEVEYLKMHMKTNHGLEEYGISLDNIFLSDDENFTVLMDGIIYDTL